MLPLRPLLLIQIVGSLLIQIVALQPPQVSSIAFAAHLPDLQLWPLMDSRSVARSSGQRCLISGFCSSGRGFAPHCLPTPPRDDAVVFRYSFTSIRLDRGLSPPSYRTCWAHNEPATRENRKAAATDCQRVTHAGRNGGDQWNIRIAEPARKI